MLLPMSRFWIYTSHVSLFTSHVLLLSYAPDGSAKPRSLKNSFFPVFAVRLKEAPANTWKKEFFDKGL